MGVSASREWGRFPDQPNVVDLVFYRTILRIMREHGVGIATAVRLYQDAKMEEMWRHSGIGDELQRYAKELYPRHPVFLNAVWVDEASDWRWTDGKDD